MFRLSLAAAAAIVMGLMIHSVEAATLHVDDFQSGTVEGWDGGAALSNQTSGGPLGVDDNFLQVISGGGGGRGSRPATFTEAPEWFGDYDAIGATAVTVDLMVPMTSPSLEMRWVLFGPTTNDNRWTSTVAAAVPNDGVWRNYEFSLAASDLTFVPFFPSTATYEEMFADVIRVMLRHDAGSPSTTGSALAATFGMDNVRLIPAPLPGDGNLDGMVDGLDYVLWAAAFGDDPAMDPPGSPENGDYNDDNVVDGLDYVVWAVNFGAGTTVAVPEPTSLWLLTAAIIFSVCSRRRGARVA